MPIMTQSKDLLHTVRERILKDSSRDNNYPIDIETEIFGNSADHDHG